MEISLIIRTRPEDAHRLTLVRRFIQTAIEQGHTIRQCFFQSAGVLAATQSEQLAEWQQIADMTHAELLLCSQAPVLHRNRMQNLLAVSILLGRQRGNGDATRQRRQSENETMPR